MAPCLFLLSPSYVQPPWAGSRYQSSIHPKFLELNW